MVTSSAYSISAPIGSPLAMRVIFIPKSLAAFTEVAQALDTFCARVDQTIAIHLVSHSNISGVELRASVENLGFVLGEDGAFHYTGQTGSPMFAIHSLTGDAFTNALLDNQSYKGFSMLLDIPHAPAGEKTFDWVSDHSRSRNLQLR